jgi:hypothetical protein
MAPTRRYETDDEDAAADLGERRDNIPERLNRLRANRRTQKRARRTRSNDAAKRGMHQRCNKRISW